MAAIPNTPLGPFRKGISCFFAGQAERFLWVDFAWRPLACPAKLIDKPLEYVYHIHEMDSESIARLLTAGGFEWDEGNLTKNEKHGVRSTEIEEVFFNPPVVLLPDTKHSGAEARYHCFGKTFDGRFLLVVFAVRAGRIRPISARAMNRKERQYYEEETKTRP